MMFLEGAMLQGEHAGRREKRDGTSLGDRWRAGLETRNLLPVDKQVMTPWGKTEEAMPTVSCFLFTGTYSLNNKTRRDGEQNRTGVKQWQSRENEKEKREREEKTLIGLTGRAPCCRRRRFFFSSFLSLFLPLLIFERFPRPYNEPLDRTRRGRFSLQG